MNEVISVCEHTCVRVCSICKYEHDVLIRACMSGGLRLMCVFLFHSPLYFLRQSTLLNLALLPRRISIIPALGLQICAAILYVILYMIGIQTQVLMCAIVRASPTEPSVQPLFGIFPCYQVFYFIDGPLLCY